MDDIDVIDSAEDHSDINLIDPDLNDADDSDKNQIAIQRRYRRRRQGRLAQRHNIHCDEDDTETKNTAKIINRV
jgi:hypothetical protein